MHVGMATVFQNPGKARSDREVYVNELGLADLAEPLGFESIWGVEHHFTDYTMCPDVLQFLTCMAGRTARAQLGSMVVVLPWHDPMRVAEEVSNLQVWGTPERCDEKILDVHPRTGNSHYVGVFSYAGMPYDEAERNIRLFAREVMPELQKLRPKPAASGTAALLDKPVTVGLLGS